MVDDIPVTSPANSQSIMDRLGVQTALQFHWWGNTRKLIGHLVRSSTWALVYYDATVVLLVRREGNEELIVRAQAAFEVERDAMEKALLEPVRSWQWPEGRLRALSVYSDLLYMIGRGNDAGRFRAYMAELSSDAR
jgi:hypothetical protein